MPDPLNEDAIPANAGRDLLLRSLREVLTRHGYSGDQLEQKIAELTQKDFPRLTAVMSGSKA